jgi:diguanylate cyclase (GGDEF)-like protein/PAS domain S-box-containing protein
VISQIQSGATEDSLAALAAHFDHGSDGLIVFDRELRCVFLNPIAERILACGARSVIGKELCKAFPELAGDMAEGHYHRALVHGVAEDLESYFPAVGRWFEQRCLPVGAGSPQGLLVFLHDITQRKQAEAEQHCREENLRETNACLVMAAATDGLTGLANRRSLEKRLQVEWEYAVRYAAPLSLLFVDVDRFKDFNDTYGHVAGDEALRQVAHLLEVGVRQTDLVARFGGEEFVILLPHTDGEGGFALAERVRSVIADAPWPHRSITVSIGAATLPPGSEGAYELLTAADQALYLAKHDRNRVRHAQELSSSSSRDSSYRTISARSARSSVSLPVAASIGADVTDYEMRITFGGIAPATYPHLHRRRSIQA